MTAAHGTLKFATTRAPRGGKIRGPRGGLVMKNGVLKGTLTATVPGNYVLRLSIGKLATLVTIHIS